eukprot:1010986-Prymnesium_polylepis.3
MAPLPSLVMLRLNSLMVGREPLSSYRRSAGRKRESDCLAVAAVRTASYNASVVNTDENPAGTGGGCGIGGHSGGTAGAGGSGGAGDFGGAGDGGGGEGGTAGGVGGNCGGDGGSGGAGGDAGGGDHDPGTP